MNLPRRLLLVEDDVVQVKAYQALGRRFGILVESTPRTSDAFRMALNAPPDLIVLDYRLEDGESLRLLECLRASPETSSTPVLVISAYLSSELRRQCLALGAASVLSKPWTVDELLEALTVYGGNNSGESPRHA